MRNFQMPRGGKRENAGRKPQWNAGKTKPVKLPELLIPEILEFAQIIDRAKTNLDPDELLDLLFDELTDSELLERAANKMIALHNTKSNSSKEKSVVELRPDQATSELTPDQAIALDKMKQFVTSKRKYFRLVGYAGTGKSYLTVQFMKWLLSQKINFVGGSPTNKAVKNLKKLAREANISIEANTVAQLLGQQPELNEQTGKEEFISKHGKSIDGYRVALIDEFSMISKSNFKDIHEAVCYSDTQVIFIGDAAQLPPVGEKEPVIATSPYIGDEAVLSTIVRYDGEIAKVAEAIRSDRRYDKIVYPFQSTEDKTIVRIDRAKWLEQAIAFFKSDEYKKNPDYVRFLVWRNRTAASLNDYVREQLWGKNAPKYVVGDRMIAKTPVFRPNPGVKGKNKWQIIMNNSEECEVVGEASLIEPSGKGVMDWSYWEVPVKTDDGLSITLRVLTEDGDRKREEYLRHLKWMKSWKKYYDVLKSFDNVPYSYAITTHKAQGSSINYIFPDIADMRPCPDLQKILYTALTRARIQAFIPQ